MSGVQYLNSEEEATQKLLDNKISFLEQEAHRFNIAKEIIEGTNTTWCAVDLNNDPEDGVYKVFNHTTGLYEDVLSLSQAKLRTEQLKDELFNSTPFSVFEVVDAIPEEPVTGSVKGVVQPNIPVKVL